MPIIQLRRGTAAQWGASNPILAAGEPGIEIDTKLMKIGNGTAHWNDLPYFIPEPDIVDLIEDAEEEITPEEEVLFVDLVNATIDLPSLVLLWENAKA